MKKFCEDLWSLTSSHFFASNVLTLTPPQWQPILIVAVLAVFLWTTLRGNSNRRRRPPGSIWLQLFGWEFFIERGPSGTRAGFRKN